jgi:phosphocarrier protein FPr
MKADQLGAPADEATRPENDELAEDGPGDEIQLTVANRLGLHARPIGRIVGAVARLDAKVSVTNLSRERGPVDAGSVTGLATLNVRQGDEIAVRALGPQAAEALAAIEALARDRFGDPEDDEAGPAPARPPAEASGPPAQAPAAGDQLEGVPAAGGIAIGPAWPLTRPVAVVEDRAADAPGVELERLDAAIASARADITADREAVARRAGDAEASIFDAHLMLLDDTALLEPARQAIQAGGVTAGEAGTPPPRPPQSASARSTIPICGSGPWTSTTSPPACSATWPAPRRAPRKRTAS